MRLVDWDLRLNQVFDEWRVKPFAWGLTDCLMFGRACELAITGASRFDDLPLYSCPGSAARVASHLGLASPLDLLDARLTSVPVTQARRGDWVYRPGDDFGALGVIDYTHAFFKAPEGLVSLPVADSARAWSIQ